MLLVIAVVCVLMYFSQIEEKLSIKKMFGYSSLRLLVKENWKLFVDVIIASLFVFSVCVLISVPEYNVFVVLLLKYLTIFFMVEMFMLFIIIVFLFYFFKKIQITQILKHRKEFKTVLILNVILRLIIVILGISIIGEYYQPMLRDFDNVKSYSKFLNEVDPFYKPDNMQQFEQNVVDYMKLLYSQVNDSGGIGIEMAISRDWTTGKEIVFYNVNENYINHIKIKDSKGKIIRVQKGELKVFASSKNIDQAKKIIKDRKENDIQMELIEIMPNEKVFTFDSLINEKGVGYVEDPIMIISGYVNPWSVFLTKEQIEKDKYDQALKDNGFKATFDIYAVSDTTQMIYHFWLTALCQDILVIVISFFALCAVITQYVLAYISSFKKSIAIKKSMGYSLLKRYDNMIMIMSFFYFAMWSYCFIWGRPLIEQVTVLIMFIFECILSLLLIIKNERRITAESLKE